MMRNKYHNLENYQHFRPVFINTTQIRTCYLFVCVKLQLNERRLDMHQWYTQTYFLVLKHRFRNVDGVEILQYLWLF